MKECPFCQLINEKEITDLTDLTDDFTENNQSKSVSSVPTCRDGCIFLM